MKTGTNFTHLLPLAMQAKGWRPCGLAKGTLRQAQGEKTSTLGSIKELKVELSVATMILIVQKAGIKKN
ncbi:MAG: hypothetical protein JWQ40_455 [Segetibacter sp.]|nr:hypothetical protein [Segetibacter sp.]